MSGNGNGNGTLRLVLTIIGIAVPLMTGAFMLNRHGLERHEDSPGVHPGLAEDLHRLELRTQRIEDKLDLLLAARGLSR